MPRFMRGAVLAALPLFVLLAGCGNSELNSTVVTGSADDMGDGVVRSWGFIDPADVPQQLNLSFSTGSTVSLDPAGETAVINVPRNMRTAYTHIVVQWLPAGRKGGTGAFATPCFAMHFYTLAQVDRLLIDAVDPEMAIPPDPAFLPAGFTLDAASATDDIGVYWDGAATGIDGAMSYGSYNGATIFSASFLTPAFLASRTELTVPIPQPAQVSASGYYPTVMRVEVGEGQSDYLVSFTDFVFRVAAVP